MDALNESSTAALRTLHASLESEREWRNIQKTVLVAVGRLVALATAQQQRLDAVVDRITGLETARGQQQKEFEALRSGIASELKDAMSESQRQLTDRVCAHVDARLATQREDLEVKWTKIEAETNRTCRNELDTLHKKLTKEMRGIETKCGSFSVDKTQLVSAIEVCGGPRKRDFTHPPTPAKQDALDRKLTRLEKMLHAVEGEFSTQWSLWRDELTQTLQSKASHIDLTASLDTHSKQFETLRHEIQSSSEDCLSRLATQADEQTKADEKLSHLKAHMHELLGIVETLQGEQTALKTLTIDHVQQQTDGQPHDTKRAVLKLHDAVKSVRRSVESVAKRAELEALNEQVAWIRKQLRSEIYQARYIWKEGRPTPKQTVAWTAQVVNTNSDVFVWQRSQNDAVTTMIPGLYHLQAAFFTSLEPMLQVLVNGEPALIVTNSVEDRRGTENESASQLNQSTPLGKTHGISTERRRLHHSGGDIVGLEISAFLALPARAVVTVGYDIDERAQGFLNLRKL